MTLKPSVHAGFRGLSGTTNWNSVFQGAKEADYFVFIFLKFIDFCVKQAEELAA
jgi:hypothetical protein